jgi:hypothetical protein
MRRNRESILYSNREKIGFWLLAVLMLTAIIFIFLQHPIAQDKSYHVFKDSRTIIGIQNFCNVFSNLLFLVVGVLGLINVLIQKKLVIINELKWAYVLFFFGIALVAFGSSYYHLSPDNDTLLWDRLPMTVAFMSLFSIVIGEFISAKLAQKLLLPFVFSGIASAVYWYLGELDGSGDLRFYVLVQFLPVVGILVILLCFQSSFNKTSGYWWLLLAYVVAKLLEHFDGMIFSFLGEISGHSLKHIAAALGLYFLLSSYEKRKTINI